MYNYYAYRVIDILSLQKSITSKDKKSTRKESLTYAWQQKLNVCMYVYYYNAKAIYDATAFEYGFTTRNRDVGELSFQNCNFRRSFTMYENSFRTPTNSFLCDLKYFS